MASKTSSSLGICCFLLIMILLFVPQGLAAKITVDTPQNYNWSEDNHDNGQSKGSVSRSNPGHAGSRTGDDSPSGTVLMSPPTTVTAISYEAANVTSSSEAANVTSSYEAVNVTSSSEANAPSSYEAVNFTSSYEAVNFTSSTRSLPPHV